MASYQPHAFAVQGCTVDLSALSADDSVVERPVRQSDLPWLTRRWKQLHMNDRLAFYPGDLLVQWFNHSPNHFFASVFSRVRQSESGKNVGVHDSSQPAVSVGVHDEEEEILGYVRYHRDPVSGEVRVSDLVPMEGQAPLLLRQISGSPALSLPFLAAAAAEMGLKATDTLTTSPAFFMLNVGEDPLVTRYLQERQPGIVIFPAALDLDE